MQYADLGEDVEIVKLAWLFLVAERIALGRFGDELAARVFVEDGWSELCQACNKARQVGGIR